MKSAFRRRPEISQPFVPARRVMHARIFRCEQVLAVQNPAVSLLTSALSLLFGWAIIATSGCASIDPAARVPAATTAGKHPDARQAPLAGVDAPNPETKSRVVESPEPVSRAPISRVPGTQVPGTQGSPSRVSSAPAASASQIYSPSTEVGAYYLDDGPGVRALPDPVSIADAVPVFEPLHPRANRPYEVFGTNYVPLDERRPFVQRGVASWYGRKFQGKPTSTGEPYDMYAMTAAHPTLPLPSYVRVTNLDNGRSTVVRVNDRGPFLRGRAIDLSMMAAHKLGYVEAGSARVEVRLLAPIAVDSPGGADRSAARVPRQMWTSVSNAASTPATKAPAPASAAPSAATATATASAPGPSPAPDSAGNHYVQLGAFSSRPAAEAGLEKMLSQFDWIEAPIRVVENAAVFRLHAGPWPDHASARRIASRIEAETGLRPWVVARP